MHMRQKDRLTIHANSQEAPCMMSMRKSPNSLLLHKAASKRLSNFCFLKQSHGCSLLQISMQSSPIEQSCSRVTDPLAHKQLQSPKLPYCPFREKRVNASRIDIQSHSSLANSFKSTFSCGENASNEKRYCRRSNSTMCQSPFSQG